MNILIIVLIVIAALVALVFMVALFVRKDYAVEREVVIQKPSEEVFNYIRYLKNQDHYSIWVMKDPVMKKEFRGTDGTVGFVYAWDGNKEAGKGEQEIMLLEEGKAMDVEIRFEKPFEGVGKAPFRLERISSDQTRVKWGMSSAMKYPMNIFLLFMNMDTLLGKDLEKSLENLKNNLEKQPTVSAG